MKVDYNRTYAELMIAVGPLTGLMWIMQLILTDDVSSLTVLASGGSVVTGSILTLYGIRMLTRPYFVFDAATGTIQPPGLVGRS